MQLRAAGVIEYLPTAHSVHELAPPRDPVFVIDPASQPTHAATFDAVEYLPAIHSVHSVASAAEPVSVIEPGAHSEQYDLPLPD